MEQEPARVEDDRHGHEPTRWSRAPKRPSPQPQEAQPRSDAHPGKGDVSAGYLPTYQVRGDDEPHGPDDGRGEKGPISPSPGHHGQLQRAAAGQNGYDRRKPCASEPDDEYDYGDGNCGGGYPGCHVVVAGGLCIELRGSQ